VKKQHILASLFFVGSLLLGVFLYKGWPYWQMKTIWVNVYECKDSEDGSNVSHLIITYDVGSGKNITFVDYSTTCEGFNKTGWVRILYHPKNLIGSNNSYPSPRVLRAWNYLIKVPYDIFMLFFVSFLCFGMGGWIVIRKPVLKWLFGSKDKNKG
jgi:hypothetical protein